MKYETNEHERMAPGRVYLLVLNVIPRTAI